jgi:hypothetical protein
MAQFIKTDWKVSDLHEQVISLDLPIAPVFSAGAAISRTVMRLSKSGAIKEITTQGGCLRGTVEASIHGLDEKIMVIFNNISGNFQNWINSIIGLPELQSNIYGWDKPDISTAELDSVSIVTVELAGTFGAIMPVGISGKIFVFVRFVALVGAAPINKNGPVPNDFIVGAYAKLGGQTARTLMPSAQAAICIQG